MSKTWQETIGGGFAYMTAPFAVHPKDRERARDCRSLAKESGATHDEVVEEARKHLQAQGCTDEEIQRQLSRVSEFFKSIS